MRQTNGKGEEIGSGKRDSVSDDIRGDIRGDIGDGIKVSAKLNSPAQESLDNKEKLSHGSDSFPLGVHKTLIRFNPAVSSEVDYPVLYPHWHNEFELFWLKCGRCTLLIGDKEYMLSAGDGVFITPDVIHSAYLRGEREPIVFYAAVFSPSFLSAYASDTVNINYIAPILTGERVIGPVLKQSDTRQSGIIDRMRELISFYDETPYDENPVQELHPELFIRKDAENAELKIKSLLFDIWYIALCSSEKQSRGKRVNKSNYDRIHKAIEYIHEHYSEKFTLEELASSVYMSKEYFSHIFKLYTNIQPFSYLNSYRIRCSMKLLETTDMKIIDIAAACGFDHVSYFNRKFVELMKCTPTDYRRRCYRSVY